MEIKDLTAILVVAMVGCVLVAGFIPVVGESVASSTTFVNDGYYTMDAITEETVRIIEWEKSTPNILTIDGVSMNMSWTDVTKSYTLIGSEEMVFRYERGANNTAGVQLFSTTASASYLSFHSNTSAETGDKVTITLESETVSFVTNGTNPINKTVTNIGTDAFVINPTNDGDFTVVMKKANIPAYVLNDSIIRFIGVSVISGPNGIALYGIGTIDDGIDISTIYTSNTTTNVSYSEPVATVTEVNGYNDLYSLDKYTFTISYTDNGTPKTFDATYSYFLVPAEVVAEKTLHADDNTASIVSMIPFILIMGIVLMFVGVVLVRRYV